MKSSPRSLIAAHYASYVNANTGRIRLQDHLQFEGIPVVVAVGCYLLDVKLSKQAGSGLLTVAGLLSAFLFGVMLQISQRAMDWADQGPTPSRETTEHATFLKEIAANAGYAALVSMVAAGVFVIATVTTKTPLRISSAVGLALGAHMVLVLLMVMKRVFALTEDRLTRATTGSNVTPMSRRRDAS
jgi:hypothetical protein